MKSGLFLYMIKTVAIQGVKGSFHHIVSQQYFENNIELIECLTFDGAVESLLTKESDAVILAIENSIAGSIIPNYALIDNHHLYIVGEQYIDVQHNLMALPGQGIHDIEEVYSHPMALLQCKEFFKKYPHIKLVEDKDTAEVAQRIRNGNIKIWGLLPARWPPKYLNWMSLHLGSRPLNTTKRASLLSNARIMSSPRPRSIRPH